VNNRYFEKYIRVLAPEIILRIKFLRNRWCAEIVTNYQRTCDQKNNHCSKLIWKSCETEFSANFLDKMTPQRMCDCPEAKYFETEGFTQRIKPKCCHVSWRFLDGVDFCWSFGASKRKSSGKRR